MRKYFIGDLIKVGDNEDDLDYYEDKENND
jgi:hypothetical protein